MIEKENFNVLNYIKKEEYTGSMDGMRYMLKKKDYEDGPKLETIIWPEPYCYAKTPEENKQRTEFAFTSQGVREAADWLNEQYVSQKELWELSKKV
ncbi:MAG: hypothetical protein HFI43_12975 [Lachnospiraceae bacterium]|nr:hypothetical protein [Lachnospiraceae bacterium]GFI17609.1 hypothetical protein IMSAGC009_02781 [Lachnospiraceae bacterium]